MLSSVLFCSVSIFTLPGRKEEVRAVSRVGKVGSLIVLDCPLALTHTVGIAVCGYADNGESGSGEEDESTMIGHGKNSN